MPFPEEESCCLRVLGPTVYMENCMAGWKVATLLAHHRAAGDILPKGQTNDWFHLTVHA